MTVPHRPLTAMIALAVCLLGFAAPASATPDRVKVGPDLYLQSAGAPPEADRSRSEPSRPGDGGRIVGGSATTIADYPWQTAIAFDETIKAGDGFQRQFCGGTLVAPQIMITAAHC
ncbi:MAG: trypsin-like serine protease, partial [Solirubrobacterales bacterium]